MRQRKFINWLPSVGFVLIIVALLGVLSFVVWIAGEDWYDRVGKPMDRETTQITLAGYSDYLESIARRTQDRKKGIEGLRKAIRLRRQIGDELGARRALAILEELTGEQSFSVKTRGVAEDGWTLGKNSQITVSNESTSRLLRFIRFGYFSRLPNMPIGVKVQIGEDIRKFDFAKPGFQTLELNLAPGETKTVVITTNKLLKCEGQSRRVGILVEVVNDAGGVTVQTSGLSPDGWTLDGEPGTIRVINPSKEAVFEYLELGYSFTTPAMPTVVRVLEDCAGRTTRFSRPRVQRVAIPIPANGERRIDISTDKCFSTAEDHRDLGVHVKLPISDETLDVASTGIAPDGWSLGTGPAQLTLSNRGNETRIVNVEFGYFSQLPTMPITVTLGGLCYERTFEFADAKNEHFFFRVDGGASTSLLVSCNETFNVADDDRDLGVHVRVVDATPVKEVLTSGLYRDGWTEKGQPARVTIRNSGDTSIRYRMKLGYWNSNSAMPIVVCVKGPGMEDERRFVFKRAGFRKLKLVVAPGRESTWEISTDKFYQPERDERQIGVNVKLHKQGRRQ